MTVMIARTSQEFKSLDRSLVAKAGFSAGSVNTHSEGACHTELNLKLHGVLPPQLHPDCEMIVFVSFGGLLSRDLIRFDNYQSLTHLHYLCEALTISYKDGCESHVIWCFFAGTDQPTRTRFTVAGSYSMFGGLA